MIQTYNGDDKQMSNKKIVSLFAAFIVFTLLAWKWTGYVSGSIKAFHEYPIGQYYHFENIDSDGIIQEFKPAYNYVESIELFIVLPDEKIGEINLSITNDREKEVFQKKYKISKIPTGEVHEYKIKEKLNPGKTYRICISYDGESEELPQIMVSEKAKNLVETGTMMIQGEPSDYYNVAISYRYRWKSFWGFGY